MPSQLLKFADRKLALAASLDAGDFGGSYGDAILVISALLSFFSSKFWPGKGIDKVRFVELWQSFSSTVPCANQISLPLLLQTLRKNSDTTAVLALEATNPHAFSGSPEIRTLVISGADVDKEAAVVQSLCPHLSTEYVRKHCYAFLFYEEVRSGYVHEYSVGASATNWPMSDDDMQVSYSNNTRCPHRRIHFPISWLTKITRAIAMAIEPSWYSTPIPQPSQWWLRG